VNVKGQNSYEAKITRIEYRGPFNSGGTKFFGVDVVGALSEAGPKGAVAATVLKISHVILICNLRLTEIGSLAAAKIVVCYWRQNG
jgi:hypothetical protein